MCLLVPRIPGLQTEGLAVQLLEQGRAVQWELRSVLAEVPKTSPGRTVREGCLAGCSNEGEMKNIMPSRIGKLVLPGAGVSQVPQRAQLTW